MPDVDATPGVRWEKRSAREWYGHGRGGQTVYVSSFGPGWDATIRYASGQTVRSPKYYTSATSAKNWAERYIAGKKR